MNALTDRTEPVPLDDRNAERYAVWEDAKPWLRPFLASVVEYARELESWARVHEACGFAMRSDTMLVRATELRASAARVDAFLGVE